MPSPPSSSDSGGHRGLRRPNSLLTRPRPGEQPVGPPGTGRDPFGANRLIVETADGRAVNLLPSFEDLQEELKNLRPEDVGRGANAPARPNPKAAFEEALAGVPPATRMKPWKADFDEYFRARAALAEVPTALAGIYLKPIADGGYAVVDRIPAAIRRPFDRALGILLDTLVSLPGAAVDMALEHTVDPGALPDRVDLGLPAYPQIRASCGETMVATWLKGHGVPIALGEVDTQLPFFSGLNLLEDMELRKRGFSVVSGPGSMDELKTYLGHGYPVMVSVGWADGGGHYALVSGYNDAKGTLKIDNYRVRGEVDEIPYGRFQADWKRHRNLMWVAHPQEDRRLEKLRAAGRISRDAAIADGLSISDIWVNERLEMFIELAYRYRTATDDLTVRLNVNTAEGLNGLEDVFGGSVRYTHRFGADTSITVYAEKLSTKGNHDADSLRDLLDNVSLYVGAKHKGLSGRVGWERGSFQAELEVDLNSRLASLDASARVSVDPNGRVAVFLGLSGRF